MHACGHDITCLVDTARYMTAHKVDWSGTLMLIVQPAEERGMGGHMMMEDNLCTHLGKPDYALAFYVSSLVEEAEVNIIEGTPYGGSDSVDITFKASVPMVRIRIPGKTPSSLEARLW
jgi:hippurate hydrolase